MRINLLFFLLSVIACTSGDTGKPVSNPQPDTLGDATINLSQEREDFIKSYNVPMIIDTSFLWTDTVYTLSLQHFSTMDSGLRVPAKYNFDTNSDFVTHNFKSQLIVLKLGDTIIKKEISKETFKKVLTPELESYATLYFPMLRIRTDTIEIGYSLVIPVTNVGIPVSILFKSNGSYEVAE